MAPSTRSPVLARGAMTAVMSSVPATSLPRVLRVALVRGGRVVEERTLPRGASVTVGSREDNTFVLAEPGAPSSHRLFCPASQGYEIHLAPAMSGRMARGSEVLDLASGSAPFMLGIDGRGKVTLGSTSLLFQMTPVAPVSPRARLPESVKAGIFGMLDWRVTVIAAFSFLFHFGAIGSLYSDWTDTIVPDQDATLVSLIQTLPHTPPPPIDQDVTPDPTNPSPSPSPNPSPRPSPRPSPGPAPVAQTPMDAASIGAALKKIETGFLSSVSGGPAARNVLDPTAPLGDLNQFARDEQGVSNDPHLGLRTSHGGPVAHGKPDLRDGLSTRSTGDGPGVVGKPGDPAVPTAPTATGPKPPGPIGPGPDDAQRVLALARVKARACYNQGLTLDANMEGAVSFSLSVNGDGSVGNASTSPSGSLSPSVVSCIQSALRGLHFKETGTPSQVNGSFRLLNPNKGK